MGEVGGDKQKPGLVTSNDVLDESLESKVLSMMSKIYGAFSEAFCSGAIWVNGFGLVILFGRVYYPWKQHAGAVGMSSFMILTHPIMKFLLCSALYSVFGRILEDFRANFGPLSERNHQLEL